jgi:hypothetical protein
MAIGFRTFQSAGKISQHIIPGAFSRLDSVRGANGNVSANNGVIMGQGYGLKPATLYQFNSLPEAMSSIYGGPLKEAVRLAFDPGNDFIPQRLFVMAVNTAVQGYGYLKKSSNNMIKLLAKGYGLYTNMITSKLETGTNYGKKLTLTFKDYVETWDDVRQQMLTIQYTGGACTLTIVQNSTTHTFTTSVGGLALDLTAYATIADLVAYIASQTNFTCTVVPGAETLSPLTLDAVTTLSIASAQTLEATMYAIINAVNAYSAIVTASDVSAANGVGIPDNVAATYFTTGANGTYTSTEWTAALLALEAEDIQFISTPDSGASAHAAIKTHCASMSGVGKRKERQFLVGAPLGQAAATSISAAQTLNSYYGLYVVNGGTARNIDGVITSFDPSYVACMLLGMKCAGAINMPLTAKSLNLITLERALPDSEVENLLKNGCCPINYNDDRVPAVVRQLNTYQTDDLKFNEFSVVAEMFFSSRDLRKSLQSLFTGNPMVKTMQGAVLGVVKDKLQQHVDMGIFTTDSLGRTFWNLNVRPVGDTIYIDYDANVTLPNNFQFITAHMHEAI